MKAKVIQKSNRLEKFIGDLRTAAEKGVYVGIPSEKTKRKDGKITNAEIGYINEFGSPKQGIPARPFLNPAIRNNSKRIAALLEPDISAPANDAHLIRAGEFASAKVKAYITNQTGFVPLAQATINARKRKRKNGRAGTKALIDTGQLRQSIHYLVIKEQNNGAD